MQRSRDVVLMSNDLFTLRAKSRGARQRLANYLLPPIALAVAIGVLTPTVSHADDTRSTAEIQAEVDRLKNQLERQQQALAAKSAAEAQPKTETGDLTLATTAAAQTDRSTVASISSDTGGTSSLEEVYVTASKEVTRADRLTKLQDVPLSVSVVSGADLVQEDAFDIGSIMKRTADVNWNQGNQRTSSISLRGIGYITQNEAQLPSVGVQMDGVPYAFNSMTSSYNFIDLADVQTTRGPQGTLGGLNNSLGTIAVNSRAPSFTPDSEWLLTIGERQTIIGQYAAGGSVIDDLLAFRASFGVEKGYGDIRNLYTTDQTYQNTDRTTGRLQFLLTPTEDFSAKLSVNLTPDAGEYSNNRTFNLPTPEYYANGAVVAQNAAGKGVLTAGQVLTRSWFSQDPNYSYKGDYLYGAGDNAVDIDGGYPVVTGGYGSSLNLDWKRGALDLSSLTAIQYYHFNARNDEGTPFAVSTTGGVYDNPYEQVSQEFKVQSTIGNFADYTAGLFAMRTRTNYQSYSNFLQDAGAYYANIPEYSSLDADSNGKYLMENSLNATWKDTYEDIRNRTAALYGNITFHVTNAFNVEAGARATYDDRQDDGFSLLSDEGNGSALNPVSITTPGGTLALGGYSINSTTFALTHPTAIVPAAQAVNGVQYAAGTLTQQQLANLVAQQYFNANYASLSTTQRQQLANAQKLRATEIGPLWNDVTAQTYSNITPTIFFSPSYKFNDEETGYVSYQHGEKAGVSQIVNGESSLVPTERTDAYELGLKSNLLHGTLVANADLYWMNIHNYQQVGQIYDPYTTALKNSGVAQYVSATSSAPWVISRGGEFDVAYQGVRNLTLRLSGAWVDAFYKSFSTGGKSPDLGYLTAPYVSYNGKVLPGASKFSADVGAQYRLPVFGNKVVLFSFDTLYRSTSNLDTTLSAYSWVPGNSITDASLGFGRDDDKFAVSLVVKNLTNNGVPVVQTWNSYEPAFARWYGLQVTGKM
jgi:iron complex outermembrane receptor protein